MPDDPRAAKVAQALHDDPTDDRGLAGFARHAGTSPRTLSRLFVAETGPSFERWRTGLRMWAALPLLADGHPVSRTCALVDVWVSRDVEPPVGLVVRLQHSARRCGWARRRTARSSWPKCNLVE